ncbi:hypothetical protein C8J56DRAFT_1067863 [Mycena floridula]|nr:hypothetical protein C8J56DRAFT_1067863 [Mycena floridula]
MPVIDIPALLNQLQGPDSATSLVFDFTVDKESRASIKAQTDWLGASSQGYIPAVHEGRCREYFLDKAFQFYQIFPQLAPAMDAGTDMDREPDIHETLQWMQKFLFLFWGNELAAANVSAVCCLEAITEFLLDTATLKNRRKKQREQCKSSLSGDEKSECILRPALEASVVALEQDVADWRCWFGHSSFGGGVDWSTLGDKVSSKERDEHEAAGAVLRRHVVYIFQKSNVEDVDQDQLSSLYKRCIRLNTNLINGTMVLRG